MYESLCKTDWSTHTTSYFDFCYKLPAWGIKSKNQDINTQITQHMKRYLKQFF